GREVESDHAMAPLEQAQRHVAAHAAEPDKPNLHLDLPLSFRGEGWAWGARRHHRTADLTAVTRARHPAAGSRPSVTLSTGNRREASDCRSPIACACFSTEKVKGWPGIATSLVSSCTTCRKSPVFDPPLCS